MRIAGIYSFNKGREVIEADFSTELQEIKDAVAGVDATNHKTKVSQEKTMPGRMLYKPGSLNKAFKREFGARGWSNHKIAAEYPTEFYTPDYKRPKTVRGAFRDMDFVKNRVGVEVQFGKYSLSEENFLKLMIETFKRLPLLKNENVSSEVQENQN
jgi:hypothetical protein